MVDIGCSGCAEGTKAEIEEKDRADLTEDERRLLDAETEEEMNAAMPTFYGPLSSWDGAYCRFCHRVGQVGALVFGAAAWAIASLYLNYGTQLSIGAGVGTWITLALIVGYAGRFPVLGPVFGPVVERIFASMGIYLTKKAEKEYSGEDESMNEQYDFGESVEIPENDEQYQDFRGNEADHFQTQIEKIKEQRDQFQELVKQEREKRQDVQQELQSIKDEKQEIQQETQQKSQKIEQVQEEKQKLRESIRLGTQSGMTKGPGNPTIDDATPVVMPHASGAGHVGPFWMLQIVEYRHNELHDSIPVPFGVWDLEELQQIPDTVPDVADAQDFPQLEDYFMFDPRGLDQSIDFTTTTHRKFDPEEDNALFHGDRGQVEDLRAEALNPDSELGIDFSQAFLELGFDTNLNPVPLEADSRGFERREELRNQKRKAEKNFREMQQRAKQTRERLEDLQHDLQLKQEKIEDLQSRVTHLRQREKEAVNAARSMEYNQGILQDQSRFAHKEREQLEDDLEITNQRRKEERRRKLKDSDEHAEEVAKMDSQREKNRERIELVEEILDVWNDSEWDDEEAKNGHRQEFIREFVSADELGEAASKKQKQISKRLVEGTQ